MSTPDESEHGPKWDSARMEWLASQQVYLQNDVDVRSSDSFWISYHRGTWTSWVSEAEIEKKEHATLREAIDRVMEGK